MVLAYYCIWGVLNKIILTFYNWLLIGNDTVPQMKVLIGNVKPTSMHTKATGVEGIKPCCYRKKIKNKAQKPAPWTAVLC